jgi:hypothetical protein
MSSIVTFHLLDLDVAARGSFHFALMLVQQGNRLDQPQVLLRLIFCGCDQLAEFVSRAAFAMNSAASLRQCPSSASRA